MYVCKLYVMYSVRNTYILCTCMYVCMHACMYVSMYVSMYVCMYVLVFWLGLFVVVAPPKLLSAPPTEVQISILHNQALLYLITMKPHDIITQPTNHIV